MKSRNYFKKISLVVGVLFCKTSFAVGITGNATPTQYTVNVQDVLFHPVGAASNSYVPYYSGTSNLDIASVAPNHPAGTLLPSNTPSQGDYDSFRVTVSKTITLKGTSVGNLSNGSPCRTVAGGALITNPFGDGSVDAAYAGSTDGGTAESESVLVPTGTAVVLPAGVVDIGSSLEATFSDSFTVAGSVPQGTITFNVTNSVYFAPTGLGTCVVIPMPPNIQVSVA